jgi:hypothetical protein
MSSCWVDKNLQDSSFGPLMEAIEDWVSQSGTLILVEHITRLTRQKIDDTEQLMYDCCS